MNRLLNSWVRVVAFWWIATTLWWSSHDKMIEVAFAKVTGKPLYISALNALPALAAIFTGWTVPMLALTAACTGAGYLGVFGYFIFRERMIDHRAKPAASWRGVNVTIGELNLPEWVPPAINSIEVSGGVDMPDAENRLLHEILGYVHANPDAPVGAGHWNNLFDHTVHVIEHLPDHDDPIMLIAAAGHDAGKAMQHNKKEQKWARRYHHDDFSAMVVSQMPSYLDLKSDDQVALYTVLKYHHKWSRRPKIENPLLDERIRKIHAELTGADHSATKVEKQQTLAEIKDRPSMLFDVFLESISNLQFQKPGIAPGVKAAGWRKENNLYILEGVLRDYILVNIPEHISAAYSSDQRQKGMITQLTRELTQVLHAKGWLVTEIDGKTAKPPLWSILSGTLAFEGVIIVKVPADEQYRMPPPAPFDIKVLCPISEKIPADAIPKPPPMDKELTEGKPHAEKTTDERRNAAVMAAVAGFGAGSLKKTQKVKKQQPIGLGGVSGSSSQNVSSGKPAAADETKVTEIKVGANTVETPPADESSHKVRDLSSFHATKNAKPADDPFGG